MDTVTCQTCSAEILGANVDAHFDWHEGLDKAFARAREGTQGEPMLDRAAETDALPAPGPSSPREELSEEFGEGSGSGAQTHTSADDA